MDRGIVPINNQYELEYRYYDKNASFKYFNRKFEIYLLERKALGKKYVLHVDNSDPRQMMPSLYKASTGRKRYDFSVTTLNWNDFKTKFVDCIVEELGEKERGNVRQAISKLSSPKV